MKLERLQFLDSDQWLGRYANTMKKQLCIAYKINFKFYDPISRPNQRHKINIINFNSIIFLVSFRYRQSGSVRCIREKEKTFSLAKIQDIFILPFTTAPHRFRTTLLSSIITRFALFPLRCVPEKLMIPDDVL